MWTHILKFTSNDLRLRLYAFFFFFSIIVDNYPMENDIIVPTWLYLQELKYV